MTESLVISIFAAFFIKHFVADFIFQTRYHGENKGTYLHIAGIEHAFHHVVATFLMLTLVTGWLGALVLAMFDGLTHYHIDYFKMKFGMAMKFTPQEDAYWWLIGLDQTLHLMIYAVITYVLVTPSLQYWN